mmetsp:Transcript_2064/g.3531  ORF Transcript_2064/g.3531 Transcript_2064/m.3531 type:complete len:366 (-) Transcript_2064:849-1946(-)
MRQNGRLTQSQHGYNVQHHLSVHCVKPCRARGSNIAHAQRQLCKSGGYHRPEEEITGQQHRAQVGNSVPPREGVLNHRHLGGVGAIGENGRTLGVCATFLAFSARGLRMGTILRLYGVEGDRPQRSLEHSKRALDGGEVIRVLTDDPKRARTHTGGSDLIKAVEQTLKDGLAQLLVGLDDLTHEEDHVEGRGGVGIAQEVHQQVHNRARNVRELHCASVDCLHKHLTVLAVLLQLFVLCLDHLFLQGEYDFVDVTRGDEIERNIQRLAPDVHVRAGKRAHNVHHHVLHHFAVVGLQFQEAIEHDQFYVVVALRLKQLAVAVRSRADRRWRGRKGYQRPGALVHYCRIVGLQQLQDDFHIFALLFG